MLSITVLVISVYARKHGASNTSSTNLRKSQSLFSSRKDTNSPSKTLMSAIVHTGTKTEDILSNTSKMLKSNIKETAIQIVPAPDLLLRAYSKSPDELFIRVRNIVIREKKKIISGCKAPEKFSSSYSGALAAYNLPNIILPLVIPMLFHRFTVLATLKFFMVIGCFGSLFLVFSTYSQSIYGFVTGYGLQGFSSEAVHIAMSTLAITCFSKDRESDAGIVFLTVSRLAIILSTFVYPIISSSLSKLSYGLSLSFIFGLLSSILVIYFIVILQQRYRKFPISVIEKTLRPDPVNWYLVRTFNNLFWSLLLVAFFADASFNAFISILLVFFNDNYFTSNDSRLRNIISAAITSLPPIITILLTGVIRYLQLTYGHRISMLFLSALTGFIGLSLLSTYAIIGIVLISCSLATNSCIISSSFPLVIQPTQAGIAFSILTCVIALSRTFINILILPMQLTYGFQGRIYICFVMLSIHFLVLLSLYILDRDKQILEGKNRFNLYTEVSFHDKEIEHLRPMKSTRQSNLGWARV